MSLHGRKLLLIKVQEFHTLFCYFICDLYRFITEPNTDIGKLLFYSFYDYGIVELEVEFKKLTTRK